MGKIKDSSEKGRKSVRRNKRDRIRIIVEPVYVGDRPIKEVLRGAVAERLKDAFDKAG